MKYLMIFVTVTLLVFSISYIIKLKSRKNVWSAASCLLMIGAVILSAAGTMKIFQGSEDIMAWLFPAAVLSCCGSYCHEKGQGRDSFRETVFPMLLGMGTAGVICILIYLLT